MKPRKPKVAYRYTVATHGHHDPFRIVLHSTESYDHPGITDMRGVAEYWRRQGDGLGTHFLVDKDGNVGQGANGNEITWAVAGNNTGSIHIELIGFARFSLAGWFRRRRQLLRTAELIAYLSDRWEIPLVRSTRGGVCLHRDFRGTGADHTDPGPGFPARWVIRRARVVQRRARAKRG